MKQIHSGNTMFPTTRSVNITNRKQNATPFRFSLGLLSSAFVLSLQLLAGKADAQTVALNATLTSTQTSLTTTNVCSPTVPAKFASGWQAGTGYWLYSLNTTGYTGISMSYSTSSSATGPNKGTIYYNCGASDTLLTTYSWTFGTTACHQGTITLPASCNGVPNLKVKIVMSGVGGTVASGGTNRIDTAGGFTATGTSCTPGSITAGSVSASPSAICSGTSTTLTLTGATGGTGITYQWQDSVAGVSTSYTNVGTNSLTLNTGTLTFATTTNVYYRAKTTCTAGTSATVTSAAAVVTVNALPANLGITNTLAGNPLLVGSTTVLTALTSGGAWTNGNPTVITDNEVGAHDTLTGLTGGTAIVTYQTFDGGTGCTNTQSATVNVAWPNTLALYAGDHGNSTYVINVAGDTTNALSQTGFSIGTPCTAGGFSGMQLPVADSLFSTSNPHISYKIYPQTGKALNVFRIHATTRQSGSGASKARIAYRVGTGAWMDEGRDVAQSSGSCGTSPNSWDFATPTGGLTITGITDSIEVAVFPYKPSAPTGTFQLNSLEVYGVVSSNVACSGLSGTSGTLTPALTYICDSGSQFMSLDNGTSFTGITGVGISYEWDSSSTSSTSGFVPVTGLGANTISYQAGNPKFHAGVTPPVIYYRVKQVCTDASFATSANAVVNVNHSPSKPTISGVTPQQFITLSGASSVALTGSGDAGSIFTWYSNDTSVLSIDVNTAALTSHNIAGDAIISLVDSVAGCFSVSKDTINVAQDHAIAAYIGKAGTSDTITKLQTAVFPIAPLAQTGYGSNSPCANGGLSGLTNNGSTMYIPDGSGAHAFYTLQPVSGGVMDVETFHATLRNSASGIQLVQLAYNVNNTGWVPDGVDQSVDFDDCGYSVNDITYQAPLPVMNAGDVISFGIYGYQPLAVNGTLQINSSTVTGCAYSPILDASNGNVPLDGEIFGNCAMGVNLSEAGVTGGTYTVLNDFGGFASITGNVLTVSGMSSGDVETGVVISYSTVDCPTSPVTATITLDAAHSCSGMKQSGVANVAKANEVNIYPNPATNVLHIASKEMVNVTVLSMDGRKLMNQENATTINVSALASGVYMIQVYNATDNSLVKTVQFTKE